MSDQRPTIYHAAAAGTDQLSIRIVKDARGSMRIRLTALSSSSTDRTTGALGVGAHLQRGVEAVPRSRPMWRRSRSSRRQRRGVGSWLGPKAAFFLLLIGGWRQGGCGGIGAAGRVVSGNDYRHGKRVKLWRCFAASRVVCCAQHIQRSASIHPGSRSMRPLDSALAAGEPRPTDCWRSVMRTAADMSELSQWG